MRAGFIITIHKTPQTEVLRIKKEIKDLGFKDFRIYIIDNTDDNRGYPKAVNIGLSKALKDKCELFFVLNSDISFNKITEADLQAGLRHFDVLGLVMKQQGVEYYGGEIDPIRLTGGLITRKTRGRFKAVDWISGSLMIIKRQVLEKIGLLSEDFFIYYEDVDYCLRAKKAGFRVGIDSKLVYEHFELSTYNPLKDKWLQESRNKFFRKYSNFRQKAYEVLRLPKTLIEQSFIFRFIARKNADKNSNFVINFASLNFSSLLIKILNFAFFLFLIRYLKPNEYGVYSLVWTQLGLFSAFVDLGTTSYGIVDLPSEKKQRFVALFNLRLTVAIVIFFLTNVVSFFIFGGNPRLIVYSVFLSFTIFSNFLSGSYLIKNALEGKLFNSSLLTVIFNTILVMTLIVFTLIFKSLPVVFLIIFLFYNLYSVINYFLIKKNFPDLKYKFEISVWKGFLKKSYAYILIGFLAGLYFKIDIYLLQTLKGEIDVGIYTAGMKFFEGLMFIAVSYNLSRTPMFARFVKGKMDRFVTIIKKDIIFLGFSGLLIALLFYYLAPVVLPFFLKNNFELSIQVARTVMFALPLILMSSVLLNVLYVMNKAKLVIFIFLFQLIVNFTLNLIFIPKYSYIAAAYITIICEVSNLIIFISLVNFAVKKNENIA